MKKIQVKYLAENKKGDTRIKFIDESVTSPFESSSIVLSRNFNTVDHYKFAKSILRKAGVEYEAYKRNNKSWVIVVEDSFKLVDLI